MNIFSFSRVSNRILHYGLYSVICHATAILLFASTSHYTHGTLLLLRFFPMLEHSLMSFVIIFIGVLGVEYIEKNKK